MLTRWLREVLVTGWSWLTRERRGQQTSGDAASRRTVLARARFWAELREGQREAAARWRG